MKALCVYESLDFERGKDPKTTLRIGQWQKQSMEDELRELTHRHGGASRVEDIEDRTGESYLKGIYQNPKYFNSERWILYNYKNNEFFYSYPEADFLFLMTSLDDAIEEIEQGIMDS